MNIPAPVRYFMYISFCGYAIIFLFLLGLLHHLIGVLAQDYQMYQSESECVQEYIEKGISRSNIQTSSGSCTLLLPPR